MMVRPFLVSLAIELRQQRLCHLRSSEVVESFADSSAPVPVAIQFQSQSGMALMWLYDGKSGIEQHPRLRNISGSMTDIAQSSWVAGKSGFSTFEFSNHCFGLVEAVLDVEWVGVVKRNRKRQLPETGLLVGGLAAARAAERLDRFHTTGGKIVHHRCDQRALVAEAKILRLDVQARQQDGIRGDRP